MTAITDLEENLALLGVRYDKCLKKMATLLLHTTKKEIHLDFPLLYQNCTYKLEEEETECQRVW